MSVLKLASKKAPSFSHPRKETRGPRHRRKLLPLRRGQDGPLHSRHRPAHPGARITPSSCPGRRVSHSGVPTPRPPDGWTRPPKPPQTGHHFPTVLSSPGGPCDGQKLPTRLAPDPGGHTRPRASPPPGPFAPTQPPRPWRHPNPPSTLGPPLPAHPPPPNLRALAPPFPASLRTPGTSPLTATHALSPASAP